MPKIVHERGKESRRRRRRKERDSKRGGARLRERIARKEEYEE